jgi:hypothetical protein
MTVREKIICRGCGAWGYEDADDPCPGLCPRCFNDEMHDQLAGLLDDAGLPPAEQVARLDARLRAAGFSDAARQRIVRQTEEAMP